MSYTSLNEIISEAAEKQTLFWEVILQDDLEERKVTREASMELMKATWAAILHASENYEGKLKSSSNLVGGDGQRMTEYMKTKEPLTGSFPGEVIAEALRMAESNACMKRIVAAPTAGASGVLPAVLVPYYKHGKAEESRIVEALYVAAGIGQVIAYRASISGAAGGCQAEIGSASAMAAGALTYLEGGNDSQICHSAAMALKNLLGLVCDPVAGLVEVPCVKRNVIGAMNALSCADMALAGIESRIPPDQVIDAMKEVGDKMDSTLRETGLGGLAATQRGLEIAEQLDLCYNQNI